MNKKFLYPIVLGIFLFTVGNSLVFASSLELITKKHQAKVQDSIKKLNQQRSKIDFEQLPMVSELNGLEAEAKALFKKVEENRAIRDSSSVAIEILQSKVESQEKQYDYINKRLFSEYLDVYESLLLPSEREEYANEIVKLNLLLEDPEISEELKVKGNINVIFQSLDRIERVIGGTQYSGKIIDDKGILVDGNFTQLGPLLYFSGSKDEAVGMVIESKSLLPKLVGVNESTRKQIRSFSLGKSPTLPIDTSLGNAIALEQTQDSVLEHLKKGGIWVYPILLFAFISSLVGIIKFIQIFSIREPKPKVVHQIVEFIHLGKFMDAKDLADQQPSPCREMLLEAVESSSESTDLVEEILYESMLNTQPRLERYLNVIAVTAAIAPLLGLLGTVTGIIKTFKLMNVFGAGDPKPLISGISEALITTELGLILAIPALILHALLSRKVAGVLARMEKLGVAFMNSLARGNRKLV